MYIFTFRTTVYCDYLHGRYCYSSLTVLITDEVWNIYYIVDFSLGNVVPASFIITALSHCEV